MAFGMVELSYLSREEQEKILSQLSNKYICPKEIDSNIYYIPEAVNNLIEQLYKQAYSHSKGDNGISQDKK